MGYTHYWDTKGEKVSPEVVETFKDHFKMMLNLRPSLIHTDLINDEQLWFNGIGDDAHETMCVSFGGGGGFNFCKTAYKPYDEVVVACLELMVELDIIDDWRSDGEAGDHEDGKALLAEVKTILNKG